MPKVTHIAQQHVALAEDGPTPLHYQIASYLLTLLQDGSVQPGDQVATEDELQGMFHVSRTTVRRALSHLHNRGLISRKQGRGTFWTDRSRDVRLEKITGLHRKFSSFEGDTEYRVISIVQEPGPAVVNAFFSLGPEDDVVAVKRVRYLEGRPLNFTYTYLPVHVGSRVKESYLLKMSMHEVLESKLNIDLGRIEHEVEVTSASAEVSEHLGIPFLDALLTIHTRVQDREGAPVEIFWAHFVKERYKFKVVLNG